MSTSIPKIIHYCWFGGKPLPSLAKKCIKSWQKYCPDYQIIRWDESNFDVNSNLYAKQAYEAKKYAFVSDYARLYVIYKYGGIYVETDTEIKKNLDRFLGNEACIGFESLYKIKNGNDCSLSGGIIGSQQNNKFIKGLLDLYTSIAFRKGNGELDLTTNTTRMTKYAIEKYGLIPNDTYQALEDVRVYPSEYFCPSNYYFTNITSNTYAIHYFVASWNAWGKHLKRKISFVGIRILGFKRYTAFRNRIFKLLKL